MAAAAKRKRHELASIRDTVESIWVAIVLAFVLRAFIIEAFVIPTGSMAESLLGEHWLLECPACHYEYPYGAPKVAGAIPRGSGEGSLPTPGAVCPNCGCPYDAGGGTARRLRGGDRVLVLKYLYYLHEPKPWDVIVFRNPQNNHENYIKRLIALPGETVEIVHGDVFVASSAKGPFRIRRKPPHVQKVMWQVVYDSDYPPDRERIRKVSQTRDSGPVAEPPEWSPADGQDDRWERQAEGRRFVFRGGDDPARLNFHARREKFLPLGGYNPQRREGQGVIQEDLDLCSDLKLSFTLMPGDEPSKVALVLSSFEHQFKAVVDGRGTARLLHRLSDDQPGPWGDWGAADIGPLRAGRGCRIALTHADFRVTLWIDDQAVLQSTDGNYTADHSALKERMYIPQRIAAAGRRLRRIGARIDALAGARALTAAQEAELRSLRAERQRDATLATRLTRQKRQWFETPPTVSVVVEGARCQLRHLKVMRDVYYTCPNLEALDQDTEASGGTQTGREAFRLLYDYARRLAEGDPWLMQRLRQAGAEGGGNARRLGDRRPDGWGVTGQPITLARHPDRPDLDAFFVLGDNSPQSHDSRGWTKASPTLRLWDRQKTPLYQLGTVPRYNVLGKAVFVYWPAAFRPPGLSRLPILPNVGRMRFVR
jgi:signal peptidase I